MFETSMMSRKRSTNLYDAFGNTLMICGVTYATAATTANESKMRPSCIAYFFMIADYWNRWKY